MVAGLYLSKWDKRQRQKRLRVMLNDVRTVSYYALLMAGCTLEEILGLVVSLEGGGGWIGPKERILAAVTMEVSSRQCLRNS